MYTLYRISISITEFQNKDSSEQTQYEGTKPYTYLRFSIGVQTQTSEGQKMLHITSSINTTSEYETIPISHITEEVVVHSIFKLMEEIHQTLGLSKTMIQKLILI